MTDKEIYQLIEEYKEESDALYERIHEQVESSIVKHAQAKKKRKKFFTKIFPVAMAFVLICLAIVLPITLQNPTGNEVIRYNDLDTLKPEKLNYNLKTYSELNNQQLLYIDLYEYAEDLLTRRYYEEGKENETVALQETFIDGNTSYSFKLTIMKSNIVVDSFENATEEYSSVDTDAIQIFYKINKTKSMAKFEYEGYKYYIEINDKVELNFLTETIESMFNN